MFGSGNLAYTLNNHLYSPHYGSSDSTKKQQKEKAEKIQ